jgi:hypothetical protein
MEEKFAASECQEVIPATPTNELTPLNLRFIRSTHGELTIIPFLAEVLS